MGKFAERQVALQEAKEWHKVRREKLAGYFCDISKLSFAGVVLGLILPLFSDLENVILWFIWLLGIILTLLSAVLANKILK